MAGEDGDEDKQHEASQKKLDDARKKGEIPRSNDLTTAGAYAGLVLVATFLGSSTLGGLGLTLQSVLERADAFASDVFSGGGTAFLGGLLWALAGNMGLWFIIPAILAVLVLITQRGLVFAPDKLKPKANRISPISNAKNKFGRGGWFEFAKSFTKLAIYSVALGAFLMAHLEEILVSLALSERNAVSLMVSLAAQFATLVLLIAAGIGAVDLLWQHSEHQRKNRMSHKELRDEAKQAEGDPHMKQQRREKGYAIAMNKMLADVPGADVVVVNPEHYAVALAWSREPGAAPVCVAKGVDEVAARIREVATGAGVPIHRDPPTARAIYATVEIGQEIAPDQYRAVAAAIRFAEEMRQRMARQARKS